MSSVDPVAMEGHVKWVHSSATRSHYPLQAHGHERRACVSIKLLNAALLSR